MRSAISFVAVVMITSLVDVDGISYSPLAASVYARLNASELRRDLAEAAFGSEGGQDRVAEIVTATRKALGGEDKIAGVKTLTAEGPYRRALGARDMEGTVTLTIARPDKMKRVEEMGIGGMVGGPMIERTAVLAGTTAWDDTQNRGGMGGGMVIRMNRGPGPGPGGGPELTEEQLNEVMVRRMRVQLQRMTAALLADAGSAWVDAGVAESPDGKADILETKEETGRTLRLFIDQNSHLPLMVQYQDPKPMVMMAGGPGGPGRGGPGGAPPGPDEVQRRVNEMRANPPQLGTFAMTLSDYTKVDGVMLPHKIETSVDGEASEEWTIEKYKVNPQIKSDTWEKK